ncbi:Aste57867_15162 [Aphanomyces stellatus]|uniref:Aste57867_15162 protein n=1 Tax=Aphanomyces stellatus TaxID=120398 RepID=A0A485L5D6_9STRA|nr:hypothetical protein As57867_015106 [Aphanomyces stellatus]VFT91971.1 Aste57867_15162 [Aphanomyces stellatus]
MFECALHGKIRAIAAIAARDPSRMTETDVNGWTPLFYAAIRNQPRAIYTLCRAGAPVDAVDSFGLSALHYACLYQRPSGVDALIQCGANVHLKDARGRTPLFLCAIHEDPIIHDPILFDARASALCVALLQAAGADINSTDADDLTALERNLCVSVAKCRMLLEAGAKMDVYDNNNSLLHLACAAPAMAGQSVDPALVDMLLQFGAQPNHVNATGKTPLQMLDDPTEPSSLAAVELLVAHGARVTTELNGPEVDNARAAWKAKRRVLATADVMRRTESPKEDHIILMQLQQLSMVAPPKTASNCAICKWKSDWQSQLAFKDRLRLGIHTCAVCLQAVCAPCASKCIGIALESPTSHAQYDLPPSIRSKRVCDGCYNQAFYAARREAAMTQSTVQRRGRSGSLHTMRVL